MLYKLEPPHKTQRLLSLRSCDFLMLCLFLTLSVLCVRACVCVYEFVYTKNPEGTCSYVMSVEFCQCNKAILSEFIYSSLRPLLTVELAMLFFFLLNKPSFEVNIKQPQRTVITTQGTAASCFPYIANMQLLLSQKCFHNEQ